MDAKIKWNTNIPIYKISPKDLDRYFPVLVTLYNPISHETIIDIGFFHHGYFVDKNKHKFTIAVIAWSELPEPYELAPF